MSPVSLSVKMETGCKIFYEKGSLILTAIRFSLRGGGDNPYDSKK
jgi:hypothetical protein